MSALPEAPAPIEEQQDRLYRFSTWVHVGPNAENCESINEEDGTNECSNPLHFHAWCRLPNQFQHRDIRETAFAAKARRARQLRDEGCDAYEILESELDELLRAGQKEPLVAELLGKDWWQDYLDAATATREREADGEDDEKPFAHIDADQERFKELDAMPAESRPADEYTELQSHLAAYGEAVNEELEKIVAPKRKALESNDVDALVALVRTDRIDAQASEEFMHTYAMQSWYTCTLYTPGGKPRFDAIESLRTSASEVITALKLAFEDLEQTERGVASGNS